MLFSLLRKPRQKAFTLVEVMISLLVLSLTSVAAYMALSSLSSGEVSTRDLLTAKNIITSRFEQISQSMRNDQNNFYNMTAINFPTGGAWQTVDEPGYPANFFESRVVFVSGGAEEKTFLIAVRWTPEGGQQKQTDHVFTLSRPADALPGNIRGTITNCSTNALISGASVKITQGPSYQNTTLTTGADGKYDFLNVTGSSILSPGNYFLQVLKTGYETAVTPPQRPCCRRSR